MQVQKPAALGERAYIVFQTHWDREWVQSFDQYRFRLVNLIDHLLEILRSEPEISFLFDGQTVVIEDYLTVRPERREMLQQFARDGRLVFGPWYVLADQFLEGDEATIRNLLLGSRDAAEYGGAMRHGYVPDSFGSLAILPAILNGFGIRSANFGRGLAHTRNRKAPLFRWQWKDSSEVLALHRGYGSGLGLAYPDIWMNLEEAPPTPETAEANLQEYLARDRAGAPLPYYYLSVGIDHMEMRPGMSRILAELGARHPKMRFTVTTPDVFMREAETALQQRQIALETVTGEMRGDATSPMLLQGVLSTNAEVKRQNRACEILLGRVLEPLAAYYRACTGTSMAHFLDYAWKTLLKNHPHDSICACSRDAVIVEMLERNRALHDLYAIMSERLMHELLPSATEGDTQPALALFNSTPFRGRSPFRCTVRVPQRLPAEHYTVHDARGTVVGSARRLAVKDIDLESYYAVNDDLPRLISKTSPPDRDARQCYTVLDVAGVADFGAAAGFSTFTFTPAATATEPAPEFVATERGLRNGCVELAVAADGTVTLTDRRTGARYPDLVWFEDVADVGDTYDFGALPGDVPRITRGGTARVMLDHLDACSAALRVEQELAIPARSTMKGRAKRLLRHRLVTTYTLYAGSERVQVTVCVDNRAVNHRLRAAFRAPASAAVANGGHFCALERPWGDGREPFPCRPLLDYVHLTAGEESGLGILVKGLYECEPRAEDGGHVLYLTLLRSTDTIGPGAGANYPVEHAKELGPRIAEFALVPSPSLCATIHHAAAYSTPLLGEGFLHPTQFQLPETLMHLSTDRVVMSCCKDALDGRGIIVRLYNPLGDTAPVTLRTGIPFTTAERVNLAEELLDAGENLIVEDGAISLQVPPFAIATLRLS